MPDTPATSHRQFPCERCGALQVFQPGTHELHCPYCGHVSRITGQGDPIVEYDFHDALSALETATPAEERITTQCQNCAAEFRFDENVHSGECPFCGTTIVTGTGESKRIKPKSLLPFLIDEGAAYTAYRKWLGSRWFAPSGMKEYARQEASKLAGVYVPYWTYDSFTTTRYSGARGDIYYVPKSYVTTVNGRRVRRTRMEQRIRWTKVRGRVARNFDDVLVGASRSLPRAITDPIGPWDLPNLAPYDEQYLSGFRSEVYQIELDEGFDMALKIMNSIIRQDIAHDIGGDRQRIHDANTQHSGTTFKHLLLPVWSAAFRYRDKAYRFVVNGRTGKVKGERPVSWIKVTAAAVAGLLLAVGVLIVADETGLLQALLG